MSLILDKLFTEPKVYSGFEQNVDFNNKLERKKYINVKNIVPAIVAMILLRLLSLPTYIVLLGALLTYLYFTYRNVGTNKHKLDFLNNILFTPNVQPFETKSYLEYDPKLIDFYYDNRWYINSNLTAYRKSLRAVNNLLRLEYNLEQNTMAYPEQLYENAYLHYKEALNNLHSSIYKMIAQTVNNDIFNNNLTILEKMLKKHIKNIQQSVIKCGYNLYDINIDSYINPSNEECKDDTKAPGYSPNYSFF